MTQLAPGAPLPYLWPRLCLGLCKTNWNKNDSLAGQFCIQTGIKIGRRNINNLRYVDDTTLMAESEEELKSLLMEQQTGSK